MEQLFLSEIKTLTEKLKTNIEQDAHADFIKIYKERNLNPTQVKQLAKKYLTFYLSQELTINLTNQLSHEPTT